MFSLLAKLGLGDEPITMRMTGCPNGCARPYMAEIGFVGDGPNSYQVSFLCRPAAAAAAGYSAGSGALCMADLPRQRPHAQRAEVCDV